MGIVMDAKDEVNRLLRLDAEPGDFFKRTIGGRFGICRFVELDRKWCAVLVDQYNRHWAWTLRQFLRQFEPADPNDHLVKHWDTPRM